MSDLRLSALVAFSAGVSVGVVALLCVQALRSKAVAPCTKKEDKNETSRAEKKLQKLQKSVQERVQWISAGVEVLGLLPRLWIEVLDPEHRYGTLLYGYFSRWELSNTEEDFFDWLDTGPGSQIDLPKYPRRLLQESKIVYLTRAQQVLFQVRIESDGRFVWDFDGEPVSLPPLAGAPKTEREEEVEALLEPFLELGQRRDVLLAESRQAVLAAQARGEEATAERLEQVAAPLIEEDLLCQLRDPWFSQRLSADLKRRKIFEHATPRDVYESSSLTTPKTSERQSSMLKGRKMQRAITPRTWSFPQDLSTEDSLPDCVAERGRALREPIPKRLKTGLTWDDFLQAIDHDEGKMMDKPFPRASDRVSGDGIFIVDKFGVLHCAMKIRGLFQHSSFVRGHCVKVAGGISIQKGQLLKLSPHSGHYQPLMETFDEMKEQWAARGVDFASVHVKPFVKI